MKAIKPKKIRYSIKGSLELPISHLVEEKKDFFSLERQNVAGSVLPGSMGYPICNKLGVFLSLRRQGYKIPANSLLKMYLRTCIIVATHELRKGHVLTSASLQHSLDCAFSPPVAVKREQFFKFIPNVILFHFQI